MTDIEALLRNEDKVFVNRQGPKRKFEDIAVGLPAQGSTVLTFHGPGGQGKTALCDELFRLTAGDGEPRYSHLRTAKIDLANKAVQDRTLMLVRIRNQFAKTGVAFPVFDIALGLAWKGKRGEEPFPELESPWLGKTSGVLADMAPEALRSFRELTEKSVETIPGFGPLAIRSIKALTKGAKGLYLNKTRTALEQLQRGAAQEMPSKSTAFCPGCWLKTLTIILA